MKHIVKKFKELLDLNDSGNETHFGHQLLDWIIFNLYEYAEFEDKKENVKKIVLLKLANKHVKADINDFGLWKVFQEYKESMSNCTDKHDLIRHETLFNEAVNYLKSNHFIEENHAYLSLRMQGIILCEKGGFAEKERLTNKKTTLTNRYYKAFIWLTSVLVLITLLDVIITLCM